MSEEYQIKNGDLVAWADIGGKSRTGRVICYHNPSSSSEVQYGFYTVLLEELIEGWPWGAIVLPTGMVKKRGVLDELSRIGDPFCPSCRARSRPTDPEERGASELS
jgi:hypothetical protein